MAISDTVIKGFSSPQAVALGMVGADEVLAREREWYGDAERLQDAAAIVAARACGKLVEVESVSNENFRLIGRFRNSDLHTNYPRLLTPNAAQSLLIMAGLWRQEADKLAVPRSVHLSVTSLARHQEYQNILVEFGKFAVPDSTHVTGNAFDFDLGGYYMDLEDGREACVALRQPKEQIKIADAFECDLGVARYNPVRLGPEHFDTRVPQALMIARRVLYDEEYINALIEMPETVNCTLHVAAAPA